MVIPDESPEAEIDSPLLPEVAEASESGGGEASVSGAVFNLSTSAVGAGIMSIPATLKILGVAPSIALIAFVAFLCDVSVEFLLRYTGSSGSAKMSYAGVMGESFGKAGATILQICVIFCNVGALITYLIIIGDAMAGTREGHWGVLQDWFGGFLWWNGREVVLLLTLLFILLPLLFFRRVDSLRFSSAISILLAVVFVIISSGMSIYALSMGTAKTPRLLPDFSILSSSFELFTTIPIIVIAFTFHFNVHSIREEMKSSSNMTTAVRLSLILCSIIYAAVGFFGYVLFGDSTMADVLSNFDRSSGANVSPILNDIVRLSYALHLILVFPLIFFSMRINLDGLLFPNARPVTFDSTRFLTITAIMVLLIYLAAIAIPNIWVLFQFFGSTFSICLSLVFPAAIVLRDVRGISTKRDKCFATGMIILAVGTSSIAISSNLIPSK